MLCVLYHNKKLKKEASLTWLNSLVNGLSLLASTNQTLSTASSSLHFQPTPYTRSQKMIGGSLCLKYCSCLHHLGNSFRSQSRLCFLSQPASFSKLEQISLLSSLNPPAPYGVCRQPPRSPLWTDPSPCWNLKIGLLVGVSRHPLSKECFIF